MDRAERQAWGPLIKAARADAGLSQDELAEQANTTRRTVGSIERGDSVPQKDVLERILKVLGLAAPSPVTSEPDIVAFLAMIEPLLQRIELAERQRIMPEIARMLGAAVAGAKRGEFFTPRSVIKAVAEATEPKVRPVRHAFHGSFVLQGEPLQTTNFDRLLEQVASASERQDGVRADAFWPDFRFVYEDGEVLNLELKNQSFFGSGKSLAIAFKESVSDAVAKAEAEIAAEKAKAADRAREEELDRRLLELTKAGMDLEGAVAKAVKQLGRISRKAEYASFEGADEAARNEDREKPRID